MSQKPRLFKPITVVVANQPNLDHAIVKAALKKLGLETAAQVASFGNQYQYNDFFAYCLKQIHSAGKWYAQTLKMAKLKGSATATVYFAVGVIDQIRSFLGKAVQGLENRAADAARQIGTGAVNAGDGINKNNLEGLRDLDRGGGAALHGTWNAMTSPVGSDRFNQGAGEMSEGLEQFARGLGKIFVQTPADAAAMVGGKLGSAWQTWWGLEHIGRPLTANEKQTLSQVFGSSVELDAIRIKEGGAGILSAGYDGGFTLLHNERAITHGNTIYMKHTPANRWSSVLVHETTHVWQNQNGGTDYISEALWAQFTVGYGYGDDIFHKKKTWAMLNPEQQGQLIQDAYDNDYFKNGGWSNVKPIYYTSQNQTQTQVTSQFMINYMNQAMPQLRAGQGAT